MTLEAIDRSTVRTTYNGNTGCACGCKGTYAEEGAAVTRRLNLINNNLKFVERFDGLGDEVIYELVWRDRVTRVYFTATD